MIIGIDLGTKKSVVGVWQGQEPYIIPDKAGHLSIPSLVLVTPENKIFAGNIAKKHPNRYTGGNISISSVKRLIGRKGETNWSWWKTYPQEVMAFILAELKIQAEKYLGQEVTHAVIAIPSHFDDRQRRATKEAAEIAGLKVVRLLNEATAAALAFGVHRQDEGEILVFDFGGGTLDVSIVGFGEGVFEVRCIEGDSNLGGDDFDQVIFDYILNHIKKQYGVAAHLDTIQNIMLGEVAEEAKIELSSRKKTSIHIPGFLQIEGHYHDLNISLDRETFENLAKPLFDRAIALVRKALQSAGMQPSDLTALLLLGGCSRIPHVRELMKRELRIEPFTGVDYETCVAQGAVIQAAVLEGNVKDVVLLDVLPNSYGIRSQEDSFSKLLEKNSMIPHRISRIFSTAEDNQSTIPIMIYQGENEKASQNTFLGALELRDIPSAPAGIPQIEVTFDVDNNMIIRVSARIIGIGEERAMMVKSPYGLDNDRMMAMKQKMNFWYYERQIIERRSQAGELQSSIDEILKDAAALDWKDISALKETGAMFSRITEKTSLEELDHIIFSAQQIYKKAHHKIVVHRHLIEEMDYLIERIEKITPILSLYREKDSLLNQGSKLLKYYMEQESTYEELNRIYMSVRSGYEETVSDLIFHVLDTLVQSDDMKKWVVEIEDRVLCPSLIQRELENLRKIKEVGHMIHLLELAHADLNSILQTISRRLEGNSYAQAHFMLIISVFIDPLLVPGEEFKKSTLLAFALFTLMEDTSITLKRRAAQIIAQLPPGYLTEVIDYLNEESDDTVMQYLLSYIDNQPPGVLSHFFLNADSRITSEISNNKEILLRLSKEPDERCCLFALDSLIGFPYEEVVPLYLSFVNDRSSIIRNRSLECLSNIKARHPEASVILSQILFDPSPGKRLCALEFIEKTRETSLIPCIFDLFQTEKDDIVKEKIVTTLGDLRDKKVIPFLLKLSMDSSQRISATALSSAEKNVELMEPDTRNLVNLIKAVVKEKYSLSIRDKLFLWRFSRNHPEMDEVVQTLKESAIIDENG